MRKPTETLRPLVPADPLPPPPVYQLPPLPPPDHPALRAWCDLDYGQVEVNPAVDGDGWNAICDFVTSARFVGGDVDEFVPVLAGDGPAQWRSWPDLADDLPAADAALKTALAAAVAAGQVMRDRMHHARGLIALLRNGGHVHVHDSTEENHE